jgi:hypothetical protein
MAMTINQEMFEPRARDSSSAIADYFRRSISLSEVAGRMWDGRYIIAACFVIGFAWGIYSVWSSGPQYLAEVSLLPAESNASEGSSSNNSALGLIAGLAGTNLGSVPKFTQFLSALHSTGVAEILDQKYAMSCRVFRGDCDQKTLQWSRRTGFQAWLNGITAELSGLPDPNGPHTSTELAKYIESQLVVTVDKTNPIVKLDYRSSRPEFAKQFVSLLVRTTNDYIRIQDRNILRQYVSYLSDQAALATNVAQRDAFDQLLLQQERKLMLSEVDVPYAATTLDGPTVLPLNTAVKKIAIFSFLGLMAGAVIALTLRYFRIRRHG